jgi:hypothetical protein
MKIHGTNVSFPTIPGARVTQVFNNYNSALYGGDRKHKGIDYGIMPGTDVYACMPGVVHTATVAQTGYGRHVRILHPDGSMSIYGHLNIIMVNKGQSVEAGQLIGKSGGDPKDGVDGDGLSTGPHLHWEIRPPGRHASDQTAVDPLEYCLQYLDVRREAAEVIAYGGLNVRSQPNAGATKLSALYRKELVHVVERSGTWARLHSLRPEWVSATYLHFTGEIIEPKQQEAEPAKRPELTDAEKLKRLWDAHPEIQNA